MLGPLLLGCHATVLWAYAALKLHQSIDAHSGFTLPFPLSPYSVAALGFDSARAHDFHHSHNRGCFGGWTIFWDWLCGTDGPYRAHIEKETTAAARLQATKDGARA